MELSPRTFSLLFIPISQIVLQPSCLHFPAPLASAFYEVIEKSEDVKSPRGPATTARRYRLAPQQIHRGIHDHDSHTDHSPSASADRRSEPAVRAPSTRGCIDASTRCGRLRCCSIRRPAVPARADHPRPNGGKQNAAQTPQRRGA